MKAVGCRCCLQVAKAGVSINDTSIDFSKNEIIHVLIFQKCSFKMFFLIHIFFFHKKKLINKTFKILIRTDIRGGFVIDEFSYFESCNSFNCASLFYLYLYRFFFFFFFFFFCRYGRNLGQEGNQWKTTVLCAL